PERFRSACTMEEISAPSAPPAKSVMATGGGSIVPLLTSISTSALAGPMASPVAAPARAATIMSVLSSVFMLSASFVPVRRSEHVARVEIDHHFRPAVIFVGRQVEGRAFLDRAHRGFSRRAAGTGGSAPGNYFRAAFQNAGAVEPESHRNLQHARIVDTSRNAP